MKRDKIKILFEVFCDVGSHCQKAIICSLIVILVVVGVKVFHHKGHNKVDALTESGKMENEVAVPHVILDANRDEDAIAKNRQEGLAEVADTDAKGNTIKEDNGVKSIVDSKGNVISKAEDGKSIIMDNSGEFKVETSDKVKEIQSEKQQKEPLDVTETQDKISNINVENNNKVVDKNITDKFNSYVGDKTNKLSGQLNEMLDNDLDVPNKIEECKGYVNSGILVFNFNKDSCDDMKSISEEINNKLKASGFPLDKSSYLAKFYEGSSDKHIVLKVAVITTN